MLTVFIADNSAAVRLRMGALVAELAGIQLVGQTDDIDGALTAIQTLKPAVVLLDTHLPGGKSIEVLATIKAIEPIPCIIMLTTFPYPSYRQKYLENGADYFFNKATEFHSVIEVLAGLLLQIGNEPTLIGQGSSR